MNDTDEEIDAAETEEEQWIEYMKKNTAAVIEQIRKVKNPLLDQIAQKDWNEYLRCG